jgi:hypothetical protein
VVKCVRGDFASGFDGDDVSANAGSIHFLYSENGSSWLVVTSKGSIINRSEGMPVDGSCGLKRSRTANGSA